MEVQLGEGIRTPIQGRTVTEKRGIRLLWDDVGNVIFVMTYWDLNLCANIKKTLSFICKDIRIRYIHMHNSSSFCTVLVTLLPKQVFSHIGGHSDTPGSNHWGQSSLPIVSQMYPFCVYQWARWPQKNKEKPSCPSNHQLRSHVKGSNKTTVGFAPVAFSMGELVDLVFSPIPGRMPKTDPDWGGP